MIQKNITIIKFVFFFHYIFPSYVICSSFYQVFNLELRLFADPLIRLFLLSSQFSTQQDLRTCAKDRVKKRLCRHILISMAKHISE